MFERLNDRFRHKLSVGRGSRIGLCLSCIALVLPSCSLQADEIHWDVTVTYSADYGPNSGSPSPLFQGNTFPSAACCFSGTGRVVNSNPSVNIYDGYSIYDQGSPGILRGTINSFASALGGGASASAGLNMQFFDNVYVFGVPVGTVVPVLVTFNVDSLITDTGLVGSQNQGQLLASLDPGITSIHGTSSFQLTNSTLLGLHDGHQTVSDIFLYQAGKATALEEQLVLGSISDAGDGDIVGHTVDAFDTSWVQLQPLVQGAYITSDSGYTYGPLSEIPEPGALALSGLALVSLTFIARWYQLIRTISRE